MNFNLPRRPNPDPAAKQSLWIDKLAGIPLPRIGVILWIAAILRIASVVVLHTYRHPITWEFGPLARNLAAGVGYSELLPNGKYVPSIYMPPAYSYFLAAFYRVAGETSRTYLAIELLQAILGVLLVYLVYRLGELVAGKRAGLAAAVIAAIYPAQVYMCNEFHGINIYIVLGVAAVYFLTKYSCFHYSAANLIPAGICMGILMLFRGEAPALTLSYAAVLLLFGRGKAILPSLAFLAISFACLAPWSIRNYVTFHKMILVCASSGTNLWIGNNPNATGSQHSEVDYSYPPEVVNAAKTDHTPLHSPELDDGLRNVALKYIQTHPKRELELVFRKLWIFFVFDPAHPKSRNPIYWLPSLLLTTLAVHACYRRRQGIFVSHIFPLISIIFTLAVTVVVFALPRYKMAIDPFIIVLAASIAAQPEPSRSRRETGPPLLAMNDSVVEI